MAGQRTHTASRALMVAVVLVASACGDDTDAVESGPSPTEMCSGGEQPVLVAYELASGAFKWAACSSGAVRRDLLEASEEIVYLQDTGHGEPVAYDAADGTVVSERGPAEGVPTVPSSTGASPSVVVDGVRIEGGQDDPTTAFDDDSGARLWSHPGSPAYDNLWAVGDGAVYVINRQLNSGVPQLVAYELTTGDTRWTIEHDPADELWPWHVDDGVLFAIWNNLALISTDDGSTIWRTHYPIVEFPRMTGVRANSDSVFVAFSAVASGGD